MSSLYSNQKIKTLNADAQKTMLQSTRRHNMIQHLKTAFMSSTTTFILTLYAFGGINPATPQAEANNNTVKAKIPSIAMDQTKPAKPVLTPIAFLEPRKSLVKSEAELAKEKKIQESKLKNEIALKKANDALDKISQELGEISANKTRLEGEQKSLKNLLKNDRELSNIPEWISSPIFSKLLAKQYRLHDQFERVKISLMPAHPHYKRLEARSTALNKELFNELYKIKIRLNQNLSTATAQQTKLKKSLEILRKKVVSAQKDKDQLDVLSRHAELSLMDSERLSLEDRTKMLDNALNQHGQNLLTSEANTSPRLVQLLDQYTDMSMKLAEMKTKWSSRHPRVVQIKNHMDIMQDQITDLARTDISKISGITDSLTKKEEALLAETLDLEKKNKLRAAAKKAELEKKKQQKQAAMDATNSPVIANTEPSLEAPASPVQVNKSLQERSRQQEKPLALAYERNATRKIEPDTTSLMNHN